MAQANKTDRVEVETPQVSSFGALRRRALRRWPVALLVALIALAASFAVVLRRSASYQANAQLLIVPLPQDDQTYFGTGLLRDAGDASLTASSAAQILHSEDIAQATAAQLGHGASPASVLDHVQVRPTPETNVLQVTASADSRSGATDISKAYVSAVMTIRWRLISADLKRRIATLSARPAATAEMQIAALQQTLRGGIDPTVQLAQRTGPAKATARTPAIVVVILALVGGLFLGVLVAIGLERLAGRVRDSDDVRREYRLAVLGEIPTVPRSLRRRGPISPSHMPPAAADRFRALAIHIGQSSQGSGTFAFISPSAGDGRTTSAVNAAVELTLQGRSVALVVLDSTLDIAVRNDLAVVGVQVVDANSAPITEAVELARSLADMVLVDGPSIAHGADLLTSLMSAQLVLVVRANHTLRQHLAEAREMLQERRPRPLGTVLVGVAHPRIPRYGRDQRNVRTTRSDPVFVADEVDQPRDAEARS